jgi:hypothetical protein
VASPIGRVAHLARRFFGHLRARPLSPVEQDRVAAVLEPETAHLFFRQAAPDQRHALEVAQRVSSARPDDREAFVAALVHDVGKAESAIGPVARSMATVIAALRLPLPDAWRRYRDHGALGAAALEAVGAPALAVAFARYHPGPPPPGVDPATWADLAHADDT